MLFRGRWVAAPAELAAALRVSTGGVDRACTFLRGSPPHGLALLESGDEIQLVSAPDCGPLVERFLDKPPPEPLSLAALEVLSIVAYEQPVTRADIRAAIADLRDGSDDPVAIATG